VSVLAAQAGRFTFSGVPSGGTQYPSFFPYRGTPRIGWTPSEQIRSDGLLGFIEASIGAVLRPLSISFFIRILLGYGKRIYPSLAQASASRGPTATQPGSLMRARPVTKASQ
jgi:hypothetical protein